MASPFVVGQRGQVNSDVTNEQKPADRVKEPRINTDVFAPNRLDITGNSDGGESYPFSNTRRSDLTDAETVTEAIGSSSSEQVTTEYKSILMTVFRNIPVENKMAADAGPITTTFRPVRVASTFYWRTEKPVPVTAVQQNTAASTTTTTSRKIAPLTTTARRATPYMRPKTPSYADAKYVYHTTTPPSVYSFINFR